MAAQLSTSKPDNETRPWSISSGRERWAFVDERPALLEFARGAQVQICVRDETISFLVPGEKWSDALNADIASLPLIDQDRWAAVLRHALTATGARPSTKWQKSGRELLAALGEEVFRQAMEDWLPQVGRGRSHTIAKDPRGIGDTIQDENANALRGFLWLLPLLKRRDGDARLAAGGGAFSVPEGTGRGATRRKGWERSGLRTLGDGRT